jgi:hypothetical protein
MLIINEYFQLCQNMMIIGEDFGTGFEVPSSCGGGEGRGSRILVNDSLYFGGSHPLAL